MSSSCSQGFPLEVVNMINEVKELESQEKTVWSEKMKKNIWRGPTFRGYYWKKRKMMRIQTKITVPLSRALTYFLEIPYGYRHLVDRGSKFVINVTDKIGPGAYILHHESPTGSCFGIRVAQRDLVSLSVLAFPSENSAIFAMKSVEHPFHPVVPGIHRIDVPLIALYFEQDGDETHIEEFISELDLKGIVGKIGPMKGMKGAIQRMKDVGLALPKLKDVTPPPYLRLMQNCVS